MTLDWISQTGTVIKSVAYKIWYYITYPIKYIIQLPDWAVAIIYSIIILLAAFIGWRVWKKREAWKYIQTDS